MVDFTKLNTIGAIQGATENNKEIFSTEEKLIFTDTRIGDDIKKAQDLAELLYKVKQAEKCLQENHTLHDWIEKQHKDKNTLSYQILNSRNNQVINAINRLRTFFKVPGAPTRTKDQIETEITTLGGQLREKQKIMGEKGLLKQKFINDKVEKLNEQAVINANLQRKDNLLNLLKWDGVTNSDSDKEINLPDGTTKKLSAITLNCATDKSVNDYSDDNLLDSVKDTPVMHYYADGTTLKTILDTARGYLTNIGSTLQFKPISKYYKTKVDGNYYNDRVYQSKHDLFISTNIGVSLIEVLRDIGSEDLKKVVDEAVSSTSERDKLKGYVDVILKASSTAEASTGVKTREYIGKISGENKANLLDKFQKSLLSKGKNDYPYMIFPCWEYIFEFMEKVLKENSTALYLNDKSHPTYLKPKKTGAQGWDGVQLDGFVSKVPSGYVNMSHYASKNPNSKIAEQLKAPYELKNDLTLKSIVNIWHSVFDGFYDKTTYKWLRNELTPNEISTLRLREEIRYVKTMRELVKTLGLTSTIDELDYSFLEIADKAEKGEWINNPGRSKLLEKASKDIIKSNSIVRAVEENRIWKDIGPHQQVDWTILQKEVDLLKSQLGYNKSEVERIDKQINEISVEENSLENEKSTIEDKLKDLQLLVNEFDKAPVDTKITMLNTAYGKKDAQGGKWTFSQADNLIWQLDQIKLALYAASRNDDYDNGDFETKRAEIQGLIDATKPLNDAYYIFKRLPGNTSTEKIKNFLSDDVNKRPSITLEDVKTSLEAIGDKFNLDEEEKDILKLVEKAIASPTDFQDAPTSDLTTEILTALFNFTADDNLLNSWKTVDGKSINKSFLETSITNNYAPTKAKHAELMSHLKERGDIDKDKTYDISDDEKKKESWEKLIKKGPEKVIKTIVFHENDDAVKDSPDEAKKKELIKKMRENATAGYNTDPKQNKFNKTRYGDPTEGKESEVTQEQLINYLFDEKLSKIAPQASAWETSDAPTTPPTDEQNGKGFLDHLTDYWYWYAGAAVLILILVGVVFWKSIADWWNGPAEEQGKGEVEEDDKEEEEN